MGCCLAGCQAGRPLKMPVPTTLFEQDYFPGSVLSPSADGVMLSDKPEDALGVHVTFLALERIPATDFVPVGSRAVFFTSSGGGDAVLPVAQLTRQATIADLRDPVDLPAELRGANAGQIAAMTSFDAALPRGVTARFSALDPREVHDPLTGESTRRSVSVAVTRAAAMGKPSQLVLVLKDLVPRKEGRFELQSETAIFDLPPGDHTSTAVVVPFHFDDAVSRCTTILVQVYPGTADAAHAAALVNCRRRIGALVATSQPVSATGEPSAWATVTAAVQSLTPAKGRRSTLVFLAGQTGASICEDLAMDGDDATLDRLVKAITSKVDVKAPAENNLTVGWLLDHTALEELARVAVDSSNGTRVPGELLAVLTAHTGEVGRHPSSLDLVLKGVASRTDLNNRLLAENMIFLEDSSPASRVRAYDWLNARHLAPAGYDPLASGRARRDALEKAAGEQ